jgi:hypothetical protein
MQSRRGEEMSGKIFKGIKQWEFEREGLKFKLPVFYYDNTSVSAVYTASTRRVRELLPLQEMKPVEILYGRCLAVFTAFEYRRTDIDPYNEFSIAFPITWGKTPIPLLTALRQRVKRCFSAYVWQLPVTTEIARLGGVELYGFPKFLADITLERRDGWIECRLSEKGEPILSLRGRELPVKRGKLERLVTYSVIDDIPIMTHVIFDPLEFAETRDRNAASLEVATRHPISKALRDMGLSRTPMAYQFSPRTQAVLFGGRNLMDQ